MTPRRAAGVRLLTACALAATLAGPAAAQAPRLQAREILVMLRLSPEHFRPDANYGGDDNDWATSGGRRRLAEQIARRHGLNVLQQGWPMPLIGVDCYIMGLPPGMSLDAALAEVSKEPLVAWSQPMQAFRVKDGA